MSEPTPFHDAHVRDGAELVDEAGFLVPAHYGDAAAEHAAARLDAVVFDRSPRGKVELTGPEAAPFLHNLCSNDVADLPLGGGCEAFLTTNKAKVVSHLYVFHVCLHDGRDALWLDVAPGQAET